MRLENTFEVPAPVERAWDLLADVPRIVPCMPGAELTETVDDSHWKAKLNVKLGPMSFAFATDVARAELDAAARRATLSARARDTRGRGGGQARIESTLSSVDGGTRVDIVTELTVSGAVAQYGRGLIPDISTRLVDRFADCLAAQLATPEETDTGEADKGEPARAAPAGSRPVGGLSLVLGALGRAVGRFLRRVARRPTPRERRDD